MAVFHHEHKKSLPMQRKPLKDLTRVVAVGPFLSEEKRQFLLKKIQELSSLELPRYESLCSTLIENLVRYCQNLPETANSYYSQPGGLVDHALNRTEAALSLLQEFMVHERSGILSDEQKLWQYALFSAAILQGIGKLFVDFKVHVFDANGQALKVWNPLIDSLGSIGHYYSYEFQKEPEIEFRRRINLLLAKALMPASGFSWIVSNERVLAIWLALLNEDELSAGILGSILIRADAIAIQRYFTEFMLKNAATHSGGRYGVGTFSGGASEHLLEKEQATGIEFIQWMIKSLDEGRIMINKAPLLMVPGGMLMCQEIFQLFVREHPEYKNWQAVQKGFLALNVHTLEHDNEISGHLEHMKNQKVQKGIVFSKYTIALPETVQVHDMKTGKAESMSSMGLASKVPHQGPFVLQKLNAAGQWQVVEHAQLAPSSGAKKGA